MNTTQLVLLAILAVLVVFYMARRRNRLSQEDYDALTRCIGCTRGSAAVGVHDRQSCTSSLHPQ